MHAPDIFVDVPAGATTCWIVRELERRHLVPRYRRDARLAYDAVAGVERRGDIAYEDFVWTRLRHGALANLVGRV